MFGPPSSFYSQRNLERDI